MGGYISSNVTKIQCNFAQTRNRQPYQVQGFGDASKAFLSDFILWFEKFWITWLCFQSGTDLLENFHSFMFKKQTTFYWNIEVDQFCHSCQILHFFNLFLLPIISFWYTLVPQPQIFR